MEEDIRSLHQWMAQGYCCSQAIVQVGLTLRNQENSQLIQVLGGLGNGMRSGLLCGAYTGGVCLMSLLSQGKADQEIFQEYEDWFEDYTRPWGGMNCKNIINGNSVMKNMRCPGLVEDCYRKAMELLEDYDVDLEEG